MTLFCLLNTARVTLATDAVVVPAREVEALGTATDAARRLSELHEAERERLRAAEAEAREKGRREGFEEGRRSAAEEFSARLLTLEERAERERDALRARATGNALGIVRRIASTLGEPDTLAALARDAARELVPSGAVVVQVRPELLDAVRDRLAARQADAAATGETVKLVAEADETLEPDQCRLRTSGGVAVLAGLETQLRSIERRTRDEDRGASGGGPDGGARAATSERVAAPAPAPVPVPSAPASVSVAEPAGR